MNETNRKRGRNGIRMICNTKKQSCNEIIKVRDIKKCSICECIDLSSYVKTSETCKSINMSIFPKNCGCNKYVCAMCILKCIEPCREQIRFLCPLCCESFSIKKCYMVNLSSIQPTKQSCSSKTNV